MIHYFRFFSKDDEWWAFGACFSPLRKLANWIDGIRFCKEIKTKSETNQGAGILNQFSTNIMSSHASHINIGNGNCFFQTEPKKNVISTSYTFTCIIFLHTFFISLLHAALRHSRHFLREIHWFQNEEKLSEGATDFVSSRNSRKPRQILLSFANLISHTFVRLDSGSFSWLEFFSFRSAHER